MFRIKHLQDYRRSDLTFCFQFSFYCDGLFSVCPLICSFPSLHYNGADRQNAFKGPHFGWILPRFGLPKTLVRDEGSAEFFLLSSHSTWDGISRNGCFLFFFWLQFPPGCRDHHSPAPDIVPWQLRSCLHRLSEIAALYEHADGTDYRPGHSLVLRWPHDS